MVFIDTMPFPETASAATAAGMLSLEHRMATHRGLLPIIGQMGFGKTFRDKIRGMPKDRIPSLAPDVGLILGIQMKTASERGTGDGFGQFFRGLIHSLYIIPFCLYSDSSPFIMSLVVL